MIKGLVLSILVSLITPSMGVTDGRNEREKVVGSGEQITKTIELETYTAIELRITADMNITIGKPTALTIEADGNVIPLIKFEVIKGRLIISSDHEFKNKKSPDINVSVAQLSGISVIGAGDVYVTKLDNEKLSVSVTGAADLHLSGKTEALSLSATGAADVDAFELYSKIASVTLTGPSDANISVEDALTVSIVGPGDVNYRGNAKVTKRIIGDGDVSKVGGSNEL